MVHYRTLTCHIINSDDGIHNPNIDKFSDSSSVTRHIRSVAAHTGE